MAEQPHFLVVTFPGQGHINPSRSLARRLAAATGARVTFSTAVSGHRLMFPSLPSPDHEAHDALLSYIPYSDGFDHGLQGIQDPDDYKAKFDSVAPATFSAVLRSLAERGHPVTYVLYSTFLWWAGDVARDMAIPSALYWIQPASVFAVYYHYFNGYEGLVTAHAAEPEFTVNLPKLPPLKIRDLPCFFTDTSNNRLYAFLLASMRETYQTLARGARGAKPRVLVNTFEALESDVLESLDDVEMIPIGPSIPALTTVSGTNPATVVVGDLFKSSDEKRYMEWLDTKPERSVVYVSFGSISVIKKRQLEEILSGLRAWGRPYLWVVRSDNREEGVELESDSNNNIGMLVEWCDQVKVLSHRAVGCFVTHCGWNSVLESLACGVPMVGVPQWSDQDTNSRMVEVWRAGVRGEVNDAQGVLMGEELRRRLEEVMGEGEKGVEIRRSVATWKEKAREALREGGSSDRNFDAFVEQIRSSN